MTKPGSLYSSGKSGPACRTDATKVRGRGGQARRFDPEVERWLATEAAAFPSSQSSIIPLLQSAQTALGYLPPDAIRAIARHVVAPPALVEGVASFYAQFRFKKPGRHRVTVCTGTACYVRGSGKLMHDIQADLNIESGETTDDGAISLESVACFGACALAPVVVLDDEVLRQQTSASMKQVIRDISSGRSNGDSPGEPSSSPAGGEDQ